MLTWQKLFWNYSLLWYWGRKPNKKMFLLLLYIYLCVCVCVCVCVFPGHPDMHSTGLTGLVCSFSSSSASLRLHLIRSYAGAEPARAEKGLQPPHFQKITKFALSFKFFYTLVPPEIYYNFFLQFSPSPKILTPPLIVCIFIFIYMHIHWYIEFRNVEMLTDGRNYFELMLWFVAEELVS